MDEQEYTALAVIVGRGHNRWDKYGRGEVSPGEQAAILMVPTSALTEEVLKEAEMLTWERGTALDRLDIPAVVCTNVADLRAKIKALHGGT